MMNDVRIMIGATVASGKNSATTEKLAEKFGCVEAFHQWKNSVEFLLDVCVEYANIYNRKDILVSSPEYADAERKVFQQWMHVLKFGEEDLLHPQMFVRPADVEMLRTWASSTVIIQTGTTRKFCAMGADVFRKYVETLIYCRATAVNVVSVEDREVYLDYVKTKRNISSFTTKVGELQTVLADEEKSLKNVVGMLEKAGIMPETIDVVTAEKNNAILQLKKYIKETEASIKTAESHLLSIEKQAQEAENRINAVENF